MSDTAIKHFFDTFQNANNTFAIDVLGSCYADTFLFGQPQGVQAVKKEDFLRVLPRRKAIMQQIGLQSSTIVSLTKTSISDQYVQVEVTWKMLYQKNKKMIEDTNMATYILYKNNDNLQIVVQIDHQDLFERVKELELL